MATMAAASQSISVTCNLSLSSSTSSALASSSNVMLGMSDSAAILRPLSLRSVPRRVSGDAQRRQRRVSYKGPSALFETSSYIVVKRSTRSSSAARLPWIIDRGTGGSGSEGKKEEKKFITKEQEPEQYWQTADEREGKNPMTTPLPYILILGVLSPFIILAVAFANNWIKIPVR